MKQFIVFIVLLALLTPFISTTAAGNGVGVIGDSQSQPYHCIGRGIDSSYNWAELAANLRSVNLGTGICQSYNKAVSGNKISVDMNRQTDQVAALASQLDKVIINLGANDFRNGAVQPSGVPALLATYEQSIQTLIGAGIPASHIMITVLPSDIPVYNVNVEALGQFNAGLRGLAQSYGTQKSEMDAAMIALQSRAVSGGYDFGGQLFTLTAGNEPHNLILSDGIHAGTALSSVMFNTLYASFLGVSPLSDAEVLAIAGLATSTAMPTQTSTLTPTNTPTPTRTSTATPSLTWTPSATASATATASQTPSATASITMTASDTPSDTPTNSPTPTPVIVKKYKIVCPTNTYIDIRINTRQTVTVSCVSK